MNSKQPAPAWHDKPTCPGLWVVAWETGCYAFRNKDGDAWQSKYRCYGPIPEDDNSA